MKFGSSSLVLFCTLSFAQFTSAHYIFATLLTGSSSSSAAVRLPKENGPVKDFTSQGATCNVNIIKPATETVQVNAGSQVGFKLGEGKNVFHPGPAAMYLGKAPGKAADWDGSGPSWSKIAEWGATFNPFKFTATGKDTFTANLPADIPDGEYLLRMEHFALHIAGSPELYVGCAQIKVSGGGNAKLATVAIPGYIPAGDSSLTMDIYYPVPTAYKVPGPALSANPESPAPAPAPSPSTTSSNAPVPTPTPSPNAPAYPSGPVSSSAAPPAGTPGGPPIEIAPPSPTPPAGTPTGPPVEIAPPSSTPAPPATTPTGGALAPPPQGPQSPPAQPPANNAPAHQYPGGHGNYGHKDGSCTQKSTQGKRSISQHRRRLHHNQF